MAERAAYLVDEELPRVPARQWVLTLPYRLRYRLAWDHALCRAVLGLCARVLLAFYYARTARSHGIQDGRNRHGDSDPTLRERPPRPSRPLLDRLLAREPAPEQDERGARAITMPTLAFAHPERALPGPVPGSRGGRTGRDARRPSGHGVNRSYALGQYGGFVEKFVGDAVMAVFGAPVTHEDDPERALRAALPTGELPERLPIGAASAALDKLHGYTPSEVDLRDAERQFPQLKGQFLVDRDGIVRWVNVEGADEGLAGIGKFPTTEQLLEAARALPR